MTRQLPEPERRTHSCGIQVIARAAAVLRELGRSPDGLSLGKLAQALDLPRSTIQRIVASLEDEGFVEMMGSSGGYRLGPELWRLLYQSQFDVISVIRPALETLCHDTGETVVFCGREDNRALVIDRVIAENVLRVVPPMGILHVPLHSTATGKALLAALPDTEATGILTDARRRGVISEDFCNRLKAEIENIRRMGFAEEQEEYQKGLGGFAVSVDTYLGHFAVALIMPVSRIPAKRQLCIGQLKSFRERVESRIGRAPRP